ncbi:DUF3450 domain-containing protein [Vibrio viridaestus]|uniref:DUF3450 domain-containing protein n=1 Tax=Vibrio viridaestus TaxID=2487322 RepID=A0A3N9TI74_9VIBR|nr:DUF3450 domain-containing protein [Vibrio viridaestus]RQW63604.1 DUF3450 domain-containing protein [Vibrio viridaestus]
MKISLALVATFSSFALHAADIDTATSIQNKTNQASVSSQKAIDKSVVRSNQMSSDIDQLNEELHNLKIYKKHLMGLVASQEDEMNSLNNQITEIKETRQGIVPLMYEMLDGLQKQIETDKPINKEKRIQRLDELRSLMSRADVSEAEKYRRILEAYQVEYQYGDKMATYRSDIDLADNRTVEADIFYLGRAVLIARSLDKSKYWTWEQSSQSWVKGDEGYLEQVNQAYALANKQIAPQLLTLPLSLKAKEMN